MALDGDSARLLALILRGDRIRACQLIRDCFERGGAAFVYEQVVCPAMREVGELWSLDRITVADEHLATATANAAVAALYRDFPWPSVRTSRVFVACPEGEHHAFGARMVADLLALDGWDEVYFGADVPTETLARKVAELTPKVVALSVTLLPHLAVARETIRRVRSASADTRTLLGGRAAMRSPEAAASVDADVIAHSAAEAVEAIRGWR